MSIKTTSLAFIDLETTGLDPERHEIVELGCLVVRGEAVTELDLKIKPEHLETAEPEALRINGYNAADWLFAVDLAAALKALSEKAEGAIMISHNITFDWPFLERAFAKTGVSNRLANVRLDLLSMAYVKLYNNEAVQRFNLPALCEHFGIKNEKSHTALSDARAALAVYQKLLSL